MMSEMMMHPGIILVLVGLLAMIAPKCVRKVLLAVGPLAALYVAYNLQLGTDVTIDFVRGYKLGILHVDKLSWIFTFIFSVLALISGIYACHNENRMEALCAMAYAGCAIGVTLAKDWLTLIFFWEAMAVTSVFLVWCKDSKISRRAGFRYLLVHMFGGNLLLAGIFLHLGHGGDPTIANMVNGPHDYTYWLMLVGICVNVAMPPVNAWLVDAYANFLSSPSTTLSLPTSFYRYR